MQSNFWSKALSHFLLTGLAALLFFSSPTIAADAEKIAEDIEQELRLVQPLLSDKHEADLRAHISLMYESPHAVESDPRTPAGFAKDGKVSMMCFACHGTNFEHFFKLGEDVTSNTVNSTCMGCHAGGDRMHWSGGPHELGNMACIDCHRMHNKNERLLRTTTQLELCTSCHLERRSDFNRPYHHPVKEGQLVCTECHNPHGTLTPTLLRGSDVNETCYQCHAEKRGPFMWEHEPVREACINCHNPHGSVNPAMLNSRPAQLCQSCHLTDNAHPADLMGNKPNKIMQVGKGCVNCHSQVHGSNHPGGSFFRQ